tara:strand:- start:113 stop:517 length:405 start_codon:yes stop_codon:yes gene_type:complete
MSDIKTFNCPACGFNVFKKYNKSKQLMELIGKRSKKTKTLLRKISNLISRNIKTESRDTYFYFLYGIRDIEDNVLNWGIEQYYQSRHYLKGKGFAYLRSIIQNRSKNMESIKENERKMIGSAPPLIEFENKEEE